MNDPIAIFLKEHDDALLNLKKMKLVTAEIKKNGYLDKYSKTLDVAMDFINEEVRVHNFKEENALFPVIEKYVDGPTISLRDEHAKMFKILKKIERSLSTLKDQPTDKIFREEFCEASNEIVQLMVNHIHKENQILFPLVKKFLSKEEMKKVFSKLI